MLPPITATVAAVDAEQIVEELEARGCTVQRFAEKNWEKLEITPNKKRDSGDLYWLGFVHGCSTILAEARV